MLQTFSFQGRDSRRKYWSIVLLTGIMYLVLFFFTTFATSTIVVLLLNIVQIPFWIIYIATSVRRFHDRDKSGWWGLFLAPSFIASWIPVSESLSLVVGVPLLLVTLWFFIELGFFKGTPTANRFGENPLSV